MKRIQTAAILFLLVAGCSRETVTSSRAQRAPSIFVISIDTLRSDRLPVYGYAKGKTPNLDQFRTDAILYKHAFSHCPQTLPAHASLFTGLLPNDHGVRDNIGYRLNAAHETLASALTRRGYATGAAVSTYVLREATGIAQGFSSYDDGLDEAPAGFEASAQRRGDVSAAALARWVREKAASGMPMFGFLHLYEPHAPYESSAELADLPDPYDQEVARADRIVGTFLGQLKSLGVYDDAVIVVLSDHGEGLGEHGEDEHGVFVYRESIQIPLLIKLPKGRGAGTAIGHPVGLAEVRPTLLRLAGAGSPDETRDLLNPEARSASIYSESFFGTLHYGWHELRAIVDDEFHFVEAPNKELYRYRSDPQEMKNLATEQRRQLFAMSATLEKGFPANFQEPSAVDPEDQRKLASLGYLGTGGGTAGARPDPKDRISAIRSLRTGFDLVQDRKFGDAERSLSVFVKENPDVVDGWWLLGQSQRAGGKPGESLRSYKEGLRRFPGNTNLLLAAADVLFDEKRYDESRAHASLAAKSDPVIAHEALARMELRRGDGVRAEADAREALRHAPKRTTTLIILADIMKGRSDSQQELGFLSRAAEQIERGGVAAPSGLHFRIAELLLAKRDPAGAARFFRLETELVPSNVEAWSSLAVVTVAQGRRAEAREILRQGLRVNPTPKMLALALESLEVVGDREGVEMLRKEFDPRIGRSAGSSRPN